MMLGFVIGCSALLAASLTLELFWAWKLTSLYRRPRNTMLGDDRLPRVAVVLAVRGADPSLAECLRLLLAQDYPRYDIKIIIDSPDDPGWQLVHRVIAEENATNVDVQLLAQRRETCTLKLSALVQAVGRLDESYGAVALIDADGTPYPSWLRDMVAPLTESGVGATTGVRWFMPVGRQWGTMVRCLWNVAALPQMYGLSIPWGGSLAFRSEAIREAGLLDAWSKSFAEDVGTTAALREHSYTVRTVAAATMVSRETTNLSDCFRFIRRQLLCARLHHHRWPIVLILGMLDAICSSAVLAVLLVSLWNGWWNYALWAIAVFAGQFAALAVGLRFVESHIKSLLERRGAPARRLPGWGYAAIPLSQWVFWSALAAATFARRVAWRGVTYAVRRPRSIRLMDYRPYAPATAGPRASLI